MLHGFWRAALPRKTVDKAVTYSEYLSSIDEIIEDARNGKMFILVDDEGRENEGDLVIPAQMATPAAVNFMAKHGRGLICLSMTTKRCEELRLPLMTSHNQTRHGTAFTLSIEAKEGVTTGISAADRARTISVAIDPARSREDLATPGHIFPLMARDGGVLVRAGHTEAAVDISRLAGLIPAGVICEIMNDDGSMSRMPDLVQFAQLHNIKIATIADLIAYRRRKERLVRVETEAPFTSKYGGQWQLRVYLDNISGTEHVAMVKGNVAGTEPVMVRMHQVNVLTDLFGDASTPKTGELHNAMDQIAAYGRGVVVVLRDQPNTRLSERIKAQVNGDDGPARLMDYGVGAQVLVDLGVQNMILLTNTSKNVIGLDGYGLKIMEQRKISLS
ncbi:MAG: 3,4-dihydroxy-2-butanone-4-phosphate synthase [Alphaproteobacteria bacterium]|nr:3,4-dihydroxy-2-butanone-4-phosphate synthase [Alphaproteobacteria bacterium]PHX98259.1 MAG: 3,4-dihydroxy-2-butanone-4-phosphate synthase [Rhodospirillaceae bacterium]